MRDNGKQVPLLFGGLEGPNSVLDDPTNVFEVFDFDTGEWSILQTEAGSFNTPAGLGSALRGFVARTGAILFLEDSTTATPVVFEDGVWTRLPSMGAFHGERYTGTMINRKLVCAYI